MTSASVPSLIEIDNLVKHFSVRRRGKIWGSSVAVKAVDGVTLNIGNGETLGLVGESGCGKSTVGRLIMRLMSLTDGRVVFDGRDLSHLTRDEMRPTRREMQMIFQDPVSALNPRMTVEDIVGEPLEIHEPSNRRGHSKKIRKLLSTVGLADSYAQRFPHEFSGGQRQRIGIARALASQPKFIVCDEAVSALDVSIQAQIINLLQDLQEDFGLTYLFISHDMSVVRHIADRVAVMYLGRIVEIAEKKTLFAQPRHPYTKALLSSVPVPWPGGSKERIVLTGDVPSPINPPSGCPFRTRCREVMDVCSRIEPRLQATQSGSLVSCHAVNSLESPGIGQ